MLSTFALLLSLNAFAVTPDVVIPQDRWLCAWLLEQAPAEPDPTIGDFAAAPLGMLASALRASEAYAALRAVVDRGATRDLRHAQREAEAATDLNLTLKDIHAPPEMDAEARVFRDSLIRRVSRRLDTLLRGKPAAGLRSRAILGRPAVAKFLSEALDGARRLDAEHAEFLRDARPVAAAEPTRAEAPQFEPWSRKQKTWVAVGANGLLWLGAYATSFVHPSAAFGTLLSGTIAWFGFQDRILAGLERAEVRLKTWWFARGGGAGPAGSAAADESQVARTAAHVGALEEMTELIRPSAPDAVAFYAFDVELPLASRDAASVPLSLATITAGARAPRAVSTAHARRARVELVLSVRGQVPVLMFFIRELQPTARPMMNTYMSRLDPARFPLGFGPPR